jgi:hypothetical protein
VKAKAVTVVLDFKQYGEVHTGLLASAMDGVRTVTPEAGAELSRLQTGIGSDMRALLSSSQTFLAKWGPTLAASGSVVPRESDVAVDTTVTAYTPTSGSPVERGFLASAHWATGKNSAHIVHSLLVQGTTDSPGDWAVGVLEPKATPGHLYFVLWKNRGAKGYGVWGHYSTTFESARTQGAVAIATRVFASSPDPVGTAALRNLIAAALVSGGSKVRLVADTSGLFATEAVSGDALSYATQIGGTSHRGATLSAIIATSTVKEADAESALASLVRDQQASRPLFIVQRTDNFNGLRPGRFVVMEAFRSDQHATDAMQAQQEAFPNVEQCRVTPLNDDPIPVVEDITGLPVGDVAFKGKSFYIVVLASEKSEAAARQRLAGFDSEYWGIPGSGVAGPPLSIEQSSHFKGLKAGDWVVISEYGYATLFDAENDMGSGLAVFSAPRMNAVKVTKTCDEPTIVSVGGF